MIFRIDQNKFAPLGYTPCINSYGQNIIVEVAVPRATVISCKIKIGTYVHEFFIPHTGVKENCNVFSSPVVINDTLIDTALKNNSQGLLTFTINKAEVTSNQEITFDCNALRYHRFGAKDQLYYVVQELNKVKQMLSNKEEKPLVGKYTQPGMLAYAIDSKGNYTWDFPDNTPIQALTELSIRQQELITSLTRRVAELEETLHNHINETILLP